MSQSLGGQKSHLLGHSFSEEDYFKSRSSIKIFVKMWAFFITFIHTLMSKNITIKCNIHKAQTYY